MTLEARIMAHLAIGKPAPREWLEFTLMDRFKWTVEYVRSLSLVEVSRLLTMMSAQVKARKSG